MLVPALLALSCWLIRFVPLAVPDTRLWGINHLLFLSPSGWSFYLVGGVLAAAACMEPLRSWVSTGINRLAAYLFVRHGLVRWLIVSIIAMIVFWLLRPPLYFLGDSISVTSNISGDHPAIYKWSEAGAVFLAKLAAGFFSVEGQELGRAAYALISVISGGVTILLFFALATELSETAAEQFLIWIFLVSGGWLILFFGYGENYPSLWPPAVGYIYFGLRYIRGQGILFWPVLMFGIAMAVHLQALQFMPSLAVLLIARGWGRRFYVRYRGLVWLAVGLFSCALGYLLVRQYQQSLEMRLLIVPLFESSAAVPGYWLFSPTHLADLMNLLMLLVPVLPVLMVLSWKGKSLVVRDPAALFLCTLAAATLAFVLLVDPKLGMGRDWDLFALSGLAFLVLLIFLARRMKAIPVNLIPALTIVTVVLIYPFVSAQLRLPSALANYHYLLDLDIHRARTGIKLLGNYYRQTDNIRAADSLENVLSTRFPSYELIPLAYACAESGNYKQALQLADSVARTDPHSVELYSLRGVIYLKMKHYARAIQNLEMAAHLGRYDARPLVTLAIAYNQLNRTDRMMAILRQAQARNPREPRMLELLAAGFYSQRQYDSALVYSRKGYALDSTMVNTLFIGGKSALKLGDRTMAATCFAAFIDKAPPGEYRTQAEMMLDSLRQIDYRDNE